MAKEKSVKVPFAELNDWKKLFNDTDNWGIKSRFDEGTGVSRNTLSWVLLKGSGQQSTIDEIRKFVKNYKEAQNA